MNNDPHVTGIPQLLLRSSDESPRLVEHSDEGIRFDAHPTIIQRDGRRCSVRRVDLQMRPQGCVVHWEAELASGAVEIQEVTSGLFVIECRLRFEQPVNPQSIGWRGQLSVADARVLNTRYQLQSTGPSQMVDAWTPFLLTGTLGRQKLRMSSPGGGWTYELQGTQPVQLVTWLDHQDAHPRFTFAGSRFREWISDYAFAPGTELAASFYVTLTDAPAPTLVLGRYPGSCRGLWSLSDHADHDSCPKLAALLFGSSDPQIRARVDAGFAQLKLPFTKSVFPACDSISGPSLQNEEFTELCRHAHAAGIEICPHGIHQSETDPADPWPWLEAFREFAPATWIDHGTKFKPCYANSGWNSRSEHYLLPHLDDLGIRYVWGFINFCHVAPHGQLDMLRVDRYSTWNCVSEWPATTWRAIKRRQPWALPHAVSTAMFMGMPEASYDEFWEVRSAAMSVFRREGIRSLARFFGKSAKLLQTSLAGEARRDLWRNWWHPRAEVRLAPVLFPEHAVAGSSHPQRWLFNTLTINDVGHAYQPRFVDRLIADYGLHFGHTYLGSTSRAHLSHAVEPASGSHYSLTADFARNLRHLAARRDAGDLWVASMRDAGTFFEAWRQLRLVPCSASRWELRGPKVAKASIAAQLVCPDTSSAHAVRVRVDGQGTLPVTSVSQGGIASIPVEPDTTALIDID